MAHGGLNKQKCAAHDIREKRQGDIFPGANSLSSMLNRIEFARGNITNKIIKDLGDMTENEIHLAYQSKIHLPSCWLSGTTGLLNW